MPDIDPFEAGEYDHLRRSDGSYRPGSRRPMGPYPCLDCGAPVPSYGALCGRCWDETVTELKDVSQNV